MNTQPAATVERLRNERNALVAMNFLNVLGLTPSVRDARGEDASVLSLERLGLLPPLHDRCDEETGLFARSVGRR
jgi:hypothetical protein